jgi:hypothetical protein
LTCFCFPQLGQKNIFVFALLYVFLFEQVNKETRLVCFGQTKTKGLFFVLKVISSWILFQTSSFSINHFFEKTDSEKIWATVKISRVLLGSLLETHPHFLVVEHSYLQ